MTDNVPLLRLENVAGQWGDFRLMPVDLRVAPGEYLVLLGPSGCGKTTLIELICGLRRPRDGRIWLGGADVTRAEPAARHVGYVPQDYDLFPTLSVRENVRFALNVRPSNPSYSPRFDRLVSTLRLDAILQRDVRTLSGGERQRVALARALMADPMLLLLDEPVSALPESHRDEVCAELKKLHTEFGLTTIHVSHNLEEALEVADRLAVMDIGQLVQVGTPDDVLDRPSSRFVAEFTRCKNIWPVLVRAGRLCLGDAQLPWPSTPDGSYWAVVRPEHLRIAGEDSPGFVIRGQVVETVRGAHARFSRVDAGSFSLWVRNDTAAPLQSSLSISVDLERLWLIPSLPCSA